ncbi:hypothetical protein [Gracilibacillus thailandensis]|uniref:Uncharacterized protein n=1 Tax=Gracilibacillus thailandensis TaxID=563735 RepID=A0A6N7R2I0_9BACI|nr:hypothetical protein [Gracilibacillus thailandensis]MRI65146.1 hypothetical protein [Gracilibacillus thailandensis]
MNVYVVLKRDEDDNVTVLDVHTDELRASKRVVWEQDCESSTDVSYWYQKANLYNH